MRRIDLAAILFIVLLLSVSVLDASDDLKRDLANMQNQLETVRNNLEETDNKIQAKRLQVSAVKGILDSTDWVECLRRPLVKKAAREYLERVHQIKAQEAESLSPFFTAKDLHEYLTGELEKLEKNRKDLETQMFQLERQIAQTEAQIAQIKADEEYFKDPLKAELEQEKYHLKVIEGYLKEAREENSTWDIKNYERNIIDQKRRIKELEDQLKEQLKEQKEKEKRIRQSLNEKVEQRTREDGQRRAQQATLESLRGEGVFGYPMGIRPAAEQRKKVEALVKEMGEGATAQPKEGGQGNPPSPKVAAATPQNLSFDLAGNWKLEWTWTVTTVYFIGKVSGGENQWTFQGILEGGGNAVWTPKKGSAQIQCTLSGQPDSSDSPAGMNCSATFPWQAQSTGKIRTISFGDKRKLTYEGKGKGTNDQGKESSVDMLRLAPTQ